jgi:lipoprotein-releasing system ATP-binding protein
MNEAMAQKAPGTMAVVCRKLLKRFTSEAETLEVLSGLDFELEAARSCSIMGASGSGKSTLLAVIGGLERFDSGEVWVGGNGLHALAEKDLPQFRQSYVGFVFQFHYLLKDFTALENVALPAYLGGTPKREAWDKAESLLESVGLGGRLGHFPSELSGGERQRTAIARALVNDPRLILADEPTGNLDAASATKVRDILFGLPASTGASVLIATHDADLAKEADRSFLLASGRLA